MENALFIAGNVASSKNGRLFGGRVSSKSCQKYYKESKAAWSDIKNKTWFLNCLKGKVTPYRIEFTFVRSSKRRFDYINPCQTVQDLMVKAGWLIDDNSSYINPSFGEAQYDKDNPGVWIKVL